MEVGEVPWPHHSRIVGAVTRTLPSPRLPVQPSSLGSLKPLTFLSHKRAGVGNTGLFILESGALSQGF